MSQPTIIPKEQLYFYLKQGYRLCSTGTPALVQYMEHKVYISAPGYTLRLPLEKFLELYSNESFCFFASAQKVNEEKDREYYIWREEKQ